MFADLNITPLVDMFVILVLFLIANFSATGEILTMTKDIQLPEAANTEELVMAPVVMVSQRAGHRVGHGHRPRRRPHAARTTSTFPRSRRSCAR